MNKIKALLILAAAFAAGALTGTGHAFAAFCGASLVFTALGLSSQPGHCYANTLTSLIPDAFKALDVVSRELTGFIGAVARDPSTDRLAVGQTLRSIVAPANTTGADITPAMSLPSAGDQTIANVAITISKSRWWKFSWSAPERGAMNVGPGFLTIQQDQIAQAIRAAVNEIETDLATTIAQGASRAYGTAGTTPFPTAADMSDLAQVNKILDDNGAPRSDRHLVLGTTAGANVRGKQSQLFKVNEAGSDALLRMGSLGKLMNFDLGESAQVNNATAGTGTGWLFNGAGAVGDTSITIDTGTGTILPGDVLTIGSHKYIADADGSGGSITTGATTLVIKKPGLRAVVADNTAITVNATSVRNAAFTRNAAILATRLPDMDEEGDQATDRETIVDANTGLAFEIARYPGFRMNVYFIGIAWGYKMLKSEHAAILLG